MTATALDVARTLRDARLTRQTVLVRLTDRCVIPLIIGRVTGIAVTNTWVTIDGWHIPLDHVTEVGIPGSADTADYVQALRNLREQAGNPHT
jgi:hypothetical protein